MVEVLLIALSLALDAFAVSVSSGISVRGFCWKHAFKMGLYFGFFQFAMPLIGWLLGSGLSTYIEAVDHWVAFALLALIGGRMVWEAAHKDCSVPDSSGPTDLTAKRLVVLAVATSIDALAVGVSMAFMDVNILLSAAVIGVVAFILSVVGGLLGKRLGCLFQKRAEIVGGLVLIAIGIKILVEHLMGG
ncbi:putative manganese efflux pump MntP [uncultured Eubacteriales bacterium]|uniref:Putative manganese efflux pump MntP n=1 Tax=uncultured Eubacteriales bacterium TaxID=172733 RepID=A0A212KLH9_9FIRM|nr:putative manganese efflux pump MntP [uncultured Eubacteriales bacterium]